MATVAAPLDALRFATVITNNDRTPECEDAFNTLEYMIATALPLHAPRWDEPFFVATDASNVGVGAVLFQGSRDEPRYITMASRALSKSERNYSATRKELRAIIFALEKFRYFVSGRRFTLFTDHAALQFIFSQPKLTPMLENWLDKLLEMQFDVVHIPGILNVLSDCLPRLYPVPTDGVAAYDDFKARFDAHSSLIRVDAGSGGGGGSLDEQVQEFVAALAEEVQEDWMDVDEEEQEGLEPVAMHVDLVAALLSESIIWDNKSTEATWREAKATDALLSAQEARGSRADYSLATQLVEPLDWKIGASGLLEQIPAEEQFAHEPKPLKLGPIRPAIRNDDASLVLAAVASKKPPELQPSLTDVLNGQHDGPTTPPEDRQAALASAHAHGHASGLALKSRLIHDGKYWPNMLHDCRNL